MIRRIAPAIALALGAVLVPLAPAAAAPDGSVPAEVRAYVTSGDLVERLDDLYGLDAAGRGIDFDETTKTGAIVRVHGWTAALLAGEPTEHPVEMRNEWVVPVMIGDDPAGVATIWINPATVLPELASFDPDPALAAALAEVPDGAALVRDDASRAWLALADDGTVTPLWPGTTGLTTPVPLDEVAILPPETPAPAASDAEPGLGLAAGVVVVLLLVIVAALAFPALRRGRPGDD